MLYEMKDLSCFDKLPKKMRELKYYLAGFADGEGCFNVSIKKQPDTRFGWVLDPLFQITQHEKNKCILEAYKRVLQCGRVVKKPGQENVWVYVVDNRRHLKEKVIPFFRKYKLVCKYEDFKRFEKIVEGLENKEHWSKEGFITLLRVAFEMNDEGKQRRYSLKEILKDIEQKQINKG